MRTYIITVLGILISGISHACELCKSHQPELLREVAHGMGPQGMMDYVIMWSSVVIVSVTLIVTILLLARPKLLDRYFSIKDMNFQAND